MNVFDAELHVSRLYADGTETGSTPLAAEDVGATINVDSDAQFQIRVGIQEIGGANGGVNDDYRLQWNKNSGGWNDVTASSSNVKADTGSTLSDGSAATDRASQGINDGVQFFVAGEQEAGDGEVTNHQLKSNEWTEHVFGLLLIAADLADTDTIDFRITRNGGDPGMTISSTPQVTIEKLGGNVVIAVPKGSLNVIEGKVPIILLPVVVAIAAAAIALTGQAPTLEETIPVGNASIVATGQVPIAGLGPYTAQVGKADLVLTGQVPIIDVGEGGIIIGVDEANLTLTGQGVTLDEKIPVGKVDLTLAGQGVTLDTGIPVGNASLVLAGQVPVTRLAILVGKADLTLAGQVPVTSIEPSPVAPTNERSVAFHSPSRSVVVHSPPRSIQVDSPSRSAKAHSPSRSVKVDKPGIIEVPSAQQFHEQHCIECFNGRMERSGSLWGMGDTFTIALWIKFEGAQGALRSGVIDIRPAANDLSRIIIHQKFLGTVLTFRIYDFLGTLRVNVDHTVTVDSMEDQWNLLIFQKFRNVGTFCVINGVSLSATASFLTVNGTKNLAIADLVTGNSQNFRLRVGHLYMWNTALNISNLNTLLVADGHGHDPYQAPGSGNLLHWYRPGEYGILCQDRQGTLDLVGASGVDINDRKVDGPS